MADIDYENIDLVGYHEPDSSLEVGPDGSKVSVPLPGIYHVGVVVGGKFLPLAGFKAGNLVDGDNAVSVNTLAADTAEDK